MMQRYVYCSVFDTNGDGSISALELRETMTNIGDKLTEDEMTEFMGAADGNGDGCITYEGEYFVVLEQCQIHIQIYTVKPH